MHLRQALRSVRAEQRGVTPVVGIILVVAITVILAATVAAFALGFGAETNTTPSAAFEWEYDADADELEVTMQTGEKARADYLVFRGTNDTTSWTAIPSGGVEWTAASSSSASGTIGSNDAVTAGDSATLAHVGPAYDLDLVYVPGDEDTSAILDSETGPAA